MTRNDEARQWLADFSRTSESSETLDYLVGVVNDEILAALPDFRDPTISAELDECTRAHWKGFMAVVARDAIEVQPGPQIFDLARTLARRGFEVTVLLAAYRIGQRALWRWLTEFLQTRVADPALGSAILLRFWSHAALWIDTTIETLIGTFADERDQWQRGSLARKAAIVTTILDGQWVDIDAAASALAYPLRQCHTAFTLRVDQRVAESEVQRLLESAARALGTALGGQPLMVSSGARSAWCWTATPQTVVGPTEPVLPTFVSGTAGTCHPGLEGFRISHSEASAALTVTQGSDARLVNFPDVEIACLATGLLDADARGAFVRRHLRGLADPDESTTRLRETLRVYLRHGGDATAAGERLNLHPNTVRYRIRQAEKKLGHPIALGRVQVELALEILATPGAAI